MPAIPEEEYSDSDLRGYVMPVTQRKLDPELVPGRKTQEKFNEIELTLPVSKVIEETAKARMNLTNLISNVKHESEKQNVWPKVAPIVI